MPFPRARLCAYEINWPSGLSLGEVEFKAQSVTNGWEFKARITATLPNFEIRDEYRARTDGYALFAGTREGRSARLARIQETVEFDQAAHTATAKPKKAATANSTSLPARATRLTFLYLLRSEIGRGRIPPPDDLNFGSQYQVSMTYAETRDLEVAGEMVKADRILVDLTGPASQRNFRDLLRPGRRAHARPHSDTL